MTHVPARSILTLNGGSSSLRAAVFQVGERPSRLVSGKADRIGQTHAAVAIAGEETPSERAPEEARDHRAALDALLGRFRDRGALDGLVAVGHRIVHGGPRFDDPTLVTPEMLTELGRLRALDPTHLPAQIAIVEAAKGLFPELPQVACFDTAFHQTLPRVARLLSIPRRYEAMGLRRYGFHGLSYAYLMEELERAAGAAAARGRVVLAHLGAGASLAAVLDGRSVDTTMGFTPTSGIPMATRSGDLDPGVLLYLLREQRIEVDALDDLLNHRSGLAGVSESSSDVRDLLSREASDPRAAEAISLFFYQASKALGALATTLGGLDTLVFSGGIGEHAAPVRARISERLGHLGVHLHADRNQAGAPVVSLDTSPCTVRVIPTDEESMIAKETLRVIDVAGGARSAEREHEGKGEPK
jgi:acetate kinase